MEVTNIEKHITTFYERNNLNIPDAEKEFFFDKDNPLEFDPEKFEDENEGKKYKMFRGFLATQEIIKKEENEKAEHNKDVVYAIPINKNNPNIPKWYSLIHLSISSKW